MSILAGCCKFCEVHMNGEEICKSRCKEKVDSELSLLKVDEYGFSAVNSIYTFINKSIYDKRGTNWKYDYCDFCKRSTQNDDRLKIGDNIYNFCSTKCIIAVMGRVYKLAVDDVLNETTKTDKYSYKE